MSLEGASSEGVVIELRAASALPLPPAPLPERCAEPRSENHVFKTHPRPGTAPSAVEYIE